MTPEQIKRVMGLVLQYGLRKWSEALFIDDCDQVVKNYEAADVAREYQTGTDAPAHGREPNVDSEETRVEAGGTGQAREPRTETKAR